MQWFKSAVLASCFFSLSQAAWAGVVVGGTRVVYDGARKEASISVDNPDKTTPYLIQSWVEDTTSGKAVPAPFIMTPPLFRLEVGQENVLRIIRTGGHLAEDQESVFWINIKSIPSTEKTDANTLQIAVKTRIKLFYRPAGLPGNSADAYKMLVFSRSGGQLKIENPTPYYVSFYRISIGDKELQEPGMVAPQSTLLLNVPAGISGAASWQSINDYGGISESASTGRVTF